MDTIVHFPQAGQFNWSFNPGDLIGTILDSALDSVEKKIDHEIDKAHGAAVDVIVQAGEQAARLIASLKIAYLDSLQKTYETADKLMRENLDRVGDLIKDIMTDAEEKLLTVADRVEDIVKFSPLSNYWIPLLSGVSPRFIAIGVDPKNNESPTITKVLVTFKGNFYYAPNSECKPKFLFGNTEIEPAHVTTKELKFMLDIRSDEPKLDCQRFSYLSGTLKVLWYNGYTRFSLVASEYKCLLGVLPTTPGKIKTIFTKFAGDISQSFKSGVTSVSRSKHHWLKESTSIHSPPGWHIVPGSASIHWIHKIGEQINATIIADDHDTVVCEYARKNGEGSFQIAYDATQPVPKQERSEDIADLKWGSSRMLSPQTGEKITKIVLEAFNGDTVEFQPRTDSTNPFIELREYDGTIQIKAKRASKINDPDLTFALRA